jgi:flagellar motility protein MotE (MotC chaperone)
MSRLSSLFLQLNVFFRLAITLRAMIIGCILVCASKLLTLTNLYSASQSKENVSFNDKQKDPTKNPLSSGTHNIQLDDQGLTLKLDFMNLTQKDIQILESLFNYREKLKEKANEITKKEDQLNIVETRIQQQLIELKRIQGEITTLLDQHDEQEEKKLILLVKIYENMKPDQAAQIFNTLPEERVLVLLQRMKEIKSAAILANMNPSQASYLTDRILGQKELKN